VNIINHFHFYAHYYSIGLKFVHYVRSKKKKSAEIHTSQS